MNLFAVVCPKKNNPLDAYLHYLETCIPVTIPFLHMEHARHIWDNGKVLSVSFSIHADRTPIRSYSASTPTSFCTFNGIPLLDNTGDASWAQYLLDGLTDGDLMPEKLGGYYNLLHVDSGLVSAWNCITRSEPIYWCENENCIVVGNRAFLVYALANRSTDFKYDNRCSLPFATAGYMVNDRTSLAGVQVLPNGHLLRIFEGRAYTVPYKPYAFVEEDVLDAAGYDVIYDEICHALLHSMKIFARFHEDPILVNLSGGKDSRIMAALFAAAKIPFRCGTCGAPNDRDVIVAAEVAKMLHVEHTISYPQHDNSGGIPRVDIFEMLRNHILMTEGMFNILEPIYPLRERPSFLLNGHGGECLRGGYEHKQTDSEITDRARAGIFLQHLSLHNQHVFLNEDGKRIQEEENERILDIFETTDFPLNNLRDYVFTVYRQGRHFCSARQGMGFGAFAFTPYLDDTALQWGWKIPLRLRKNDTLYYNILKRLSPGLCMHRFADSRWMFEQNGPGPDTTYEDWLKRAPLPPSPPISGAHNWRMGVDDYLRPIIRDFLLGHKSDSYYELINFANLEDVLNQPGETQYSNLRSILGILTVIYLHSNQWKN